MQWYKTRYRASNCTLHYNNFNTHTILKGMNKNEYERNCNLLLKYNLNINSMCKCLSDSMLTRLTNLTFVAVVV